MGEIYLFPERAQQKIKEADLEKNTVYVFGMMGFGKTALVKNYLGNKKYIYFDTSKILSEDLKVPPRKSRKGDGELVRQTVVLDNLQFANQQELSEAIIGLLDRSDLWVIIISRSKCPGWLLSYRFKTKRFTVIEEIDMVLTMQQIEKYMELNDIILDEDSVKCIYTYSRGHALAIIITMETLMKNYSRYGGNYIFREENIQETKEVLWGVLEEDVIMHWDPELVRFLMEVSIVDGFTIEMAEEITGSRRVEYFLKQADSIGNFLNYINGEFVLESILVQCFRRKIIQLYSKESINRLYYNAAKYYRRVNRVPEALDMYYLGGYRDEVRDLLEENAIINPGSGYLFELRKYYLALSDDEIRKSIGMMAGMSLLYSIMMEFEKSDKWYDEIVEYAHEKRGAERRIARGWIAYLNIALVHKGCDNIVECMLKAYPLILDRQISMNEFCITSNLPSQMNGGKDFCSWSKKDDEIAKKYGKIITLCLGRYGQGLIGLALGESHFERGADLTDVLKLISKGQMGAEIKGVYEQLFVAAGFLSKIQLLEGNLEEAKNIMKAFRKRAEEENLVKMLPNIDAFLCNLILYEGDMVNINEWMNLAPDENGIFSVTERYQYLMKIRIYIMNQKWTQAMALIERLLYYAEMTKRKYIEIQLLLFKSYIQYYLDDDEWNETFQNMYSLAEEHHFVRVISLEAGLAAELLKNAKLEIKDKKLYKQIVDETKQMAVNYPSYIKILGEEEKIADNALQVLKLQAQGISNAEIAKMLNIKVSTVKYHCQSNYRKLGVANKTEAIAEAKRRKLI